MAIKVGMVSLGCSKNQVDAEQMLARLRAGGFELTADSGFCDVVIVNTCGFIEQAKQESIENILEFCTLKKEGQIKLVVITGCLAERYRELVAGEIPEADVVLGIGCNGDIVSVIKEAMEGHKVVRFGKKEDLPLEGERILANPAFFAYLKVADGCDNRCTFCAIPQIRGSFRSRRLEDIMEEARRLAGAGVKELNVVAQDTTRYGADLYGKLMLPVLLEQLCSIEGIAWVRVLYCYPDRVTDELLDVIARQPKLVKYIDLPIQHASGRILREMNRRGDRASLTALMKRIRDRLGDGVAIRTTCITGFPGETEEDFEELCGLVKEARFQRLGCFTYSQEEDTPAAEMAEQLDEETKRRRADIIMEEQMGIMEAFNATMIGRTLPVLVEGYDRYAQTFFGRSYMDAPDIDTKTFFSSEAPLRPGEIVDVQIEGTLDYDLCGRAVSQGV